MSESETSPLPLSNTGRATELLRGATASVPVLIGFIPFALVFGAQASQKGLEAWQVALMAGLNFGGGSEFAAIEVWTSPPHVLLIVAMTFLINSRHLLMGASLAPYLKHLPMKRVLPMLFFMCDESWAMGLKDACQRRSTPAFSAAYFLGLSVCLWLTWALFPALGAAIGPLLGDVHAYGFDMAFAAVFLVLLRGMWRGVHAAMPWLVSLGTAALTYVMTPGGWYVLAGTLAGLTWAYLWAKA